MSYELTAILNRCTKDDAKFLIETIDSYLNITDDKGLKELYESWEGEGPMPRVLNHKIETEIRYLGSNDFAYMTRKLRGYEPAGVSVDEIIDDLCKLLKLEISTARTLESRLEIFAGKVIDLQFSKLPDERKREILKGMDFEKHHLQEILDRVIDNKEMLLTVILPFLAGKLGPEIIQTLLMSIIARFIGQEAAEKILLVIASRLPMAGAWLNPLLWVGGTGWLILDLLGPASRKTIPLILYLGVLCFRDGETKDFKENFAK